MPGLNLCINHKQEWKQSHYAEHNCDYCKLQTKMLEGEIKNACLAGLLKEAYENELMLKQQLEKETERADAETQSWDAQRKLLDNVKQQRDDLKVQVAGLLDDLHTTEQQHGELLAALKYAYEYMPISVDIRRRVYKAIAKAVNKC